MGFPFSRACAIQRDAHRRCSSAIQSRSDVWQRARRTQDYAAAIKWSRLAAEQGIAKAQYNLGIMYSNGKGVTQNYAEAINWYRLAAEQGNTDAQNNLGTMYDKGRGVTQDYISAHMWYNIAAALGDKIANENRDIVANKMAPTQIAEAQKMALEWMEKHPSQ